ncbi:MAG: OmpP1/FadL family transporter [Planctomycetota bacterium]
MTSPRTTARLATPATLALPLVLAGTALGQAGGIYLPENGGPSNATAQAGSGAVARDAETAHLNPAGMTRLQSTELMFSLMPFNLDVSFNQDAATTASGGDGGNQGGWFPAAALYLAMPLNETFALGFSMTSPGGMVLDPDDTWAGRTWMTEISFVALNFEPSVGVRLSDQWSIGAGIDIQYATFEQDLVGPLLGVPLKIDGDDWNVGFSASVLWEPMETTRFGVRYRSEIAHDLSGDLLADVGWTDWSAFDRNVISFDGSGQSVDLTREFKDTWNVSLGAHVRTGENWLVMFGAGYVSSSVDDANRTPDLPVDEQLRLSAGFEYDLNDRWKIGANYTFAWLGENKIDQTRPITGRLVGDYDAAVHIIGLHASLKF